MAVSASKKCWQYWRDNFAAARTGRGMILFGLFVAWQLVYGSVRYWQIRGEWEDVRVARMLDLCEAFAVGFFAVRVFVWLPFRRQEAEKEKSAAGLAARETTIQRLKSQLNEAEKRKGILKELGYFHTRLGERLREIKGMTAQGFCEDNRAAFESRVIDKTTMKLIGLIEFTLRLEVKGTSVAVFHDKTDLIRTDMALVGTAFRDAEAHRQTVIDYVTHYQRQLLKIIEMVS
jgi:hypothetical protein